MSRSRRALRLSPLEPRLQPAGGLLASYFDTRDFSGPAVERTDARVDFDWAGGSPAAGLGADTFSVRWAGSVTAPAAGAYTFRAVADDGVQVWVGGQLVIDDWGDHAARPATAAPLTLAAGQTVPVQMEYYENGGLASARLQWQPPGQTAFVPVPTGQLTPAPATADLARGRPATASSSWSDTYAPGRGTDGVLGTLWASASGDPAPWWQVDLGTAARVGRVELLARQDRYDQPFARQNFAVRASNTPDFAQSVVLASQGATAVAHRGLWSAAATDANSYRYLRVAKTDGSHFNFAEFRAFPAAGTPTPPPPAPPTPPPPAPPTPTASPAGLTPLTSGPLGGAANDDAVTGSAVQADGTLVLAGRIGGAPGGLAPRLLNGATPDSPGAVVRLAADGRTVLSVTRLAATVTDLSTDAAGNLFVATGAGGLLKLDPAASAVAWAKPGPAVRVDAGRDGDVAVLGGSGFTVDGTLFTNNGTVTVYSGAGVPLGSFPTLAGRGTYDVALDGGRDSVFTTGFLQTRGADGLPVQIAYLRGQGYDGAQKWLGYNWGGSQVDGIGETNNMADTRGLRLDVGDDGKLYAAFQAAGGNHIFRYSPQDVLRPVPLVGGDAYHEFYNTRSEHKTVFGRYDADTGAFLLGQQLTGRLPDGRGNTLTLNQGGDIRADAAGRVYLAGAAAWGLPLSFDPLPAGTYTGGSFVVALSADFRTRLLTTRPSSSGAMLTVAARVLPGEADARLVAAGKGGAGGWVKDGVQGAFGGGTADGHYAVFGPGRTDLALNKPATASASAPGSSPAAAVDADPATRWRGVAADNQWLQVDLGGRRTVSGVVLAWGDTFATRLRVQLSDDGTTWRDVWATTAGTGGTTTVRAGGVGRFVRLSLETRSGAAGVELAGLAVWGD